MFENHSDLTAEQAAEAMKPIDMKAPATKQDLEDALKALAFQLYCVLFLLALVLLTK